MSFAALIMQVEGSHVPLCANHKQDEDSDREVIGTIVSLTAQVNFSQCRLVV